MAHGREGPDIVMQTRYAGASEIRSVTDHEQNRTPDGSSAIDPLRSHLNRILLGPSTQQEALESMWRKGVRKPSAQAESPYVQSVISASPTFFALHDDEGFVEWDQDKLDEWVETTMAWLKKEYGEDLVHVSLHLDETTPHLHVLIVPTYERKNRKPSRRKKSGETIEEFQERLTEWENNPQITRTAGRSSSEYWSKVHCRTDARRSYHAAVQHLGLGYGRDFVAERSPSPTHKVTGTWVREEAARLAEERRQLDADRASIATDRAAMIEEAKVSVSRVRSRATEIMIATKEVVKEIREEVEIEKAQLSEDQAKLHQDRADFEFERASLHDEVRFLRDQLKGALKTVIRWIKGKELSDKMAAEGTQLVRDHHQLVSPPEETPEDAGPGF